MRNLVQFAPYFPPHVGGLESYAQGLAKAWAAQGAGKITVATFSTGQPAETASYEKDGYQVVVLPAWEVVNGFPLPKIWSPAFWRGLALLRSGSPDGVLTHTRFFASTPLGGWFARRNGCRWVHLEHGSGPVAGQSAAVALFSRAWDATLGKWALRSADAVLGASESCKQYVTRFSGRQDVGVAIQGVDVPETARTKNEVPTITFVGRLVALKNVACLLRAAASLAKDGKEYRLRIVGDGPEKGALEKLARDLGLCGKVEFLGALPRERILAEILPETDVFVNPSLQEGLPTTVIEAAASGCRVVATDVGGTREIAPEGPDFALVPPNDEAALAGALRAVLERKEPADLASGVRARFGWAGALSSLQGRGGTEGRRKVYLFINSLENGGAERVVTNAAKELSQSCDVTIVTIKSAAFYGVPEGVRHVALSDVRSNLLMALGIPWFALRLGLFLRREKFDDGVSFLEIANFAHVLARRNAKISLRIDLGFFKGASGLAYRALMRFLYPLAGVIVTNSEENRVDLGDWLGLPPERTATIYNPVDPEALAQAAKAPVREDVAARAAGKTVFVTVGRVVWQKRHALIAEALGKLAGAGRDFLWIVIGDGPEMGALEKAAEKWGIRDHTAILGKMENPFPYVSMADAFVYASLHEGFPNVLIEAVALGTPVITADFKTGAYECVFGEYSPAGREGRKYPLPGPNGALLDPDDFPAQFVDFCGRLDTMASERAGLWKFQEGGFVRLLTGQR